MTYNQSHPPEQLPQDNEKPTLVVLGSGWGATAFLKDLDTDEYNVVVISPRNYFLFTPLLPSVTVGTLEPRSIIQPTRYITRHKNRAVKVYEASAQDVDPVKKTVTFEGGLGRSHTHFNLKYHADNDQTCRISAASLDRSPSHTTTSCTRSDAKTRLSVSRVLRTMGVSSRSCLTRTRSGPSFWTVSHTGNYMRDRANIRYRICIVQGPAAGGDRPTDAHGRCGWWTNGC